jgi:hypothetical protein
MTTAAARPPRSSSDSYAHSVVEMPPSAGSPTSSAGSASGRSRSPCVRARGCVRSVCVCRGGGAGACVCAWFHLRGVGGSEVLWCGGNTPTQHHQPQHTPHHSTAQHSTAQHSTAQHSTAQHSTAQHSTAQHSTAQHTRPHAPAPAVCQRAQGCSHRPRSPPHSGRSATAAAAAAAAAHCRRRCRRRRRCCCCCCRRQPSLLP